jgi:hypothetical protein
MNDTTISLPGTVLFSGYYPMSLIMPTTCDLLKTIRKHGGSVTYLGGFICHAYTEADSAIEQQSVDFDINYALNNPYPARQ